MSICVQRQQQQEPQRIEAAFLASRKKQLTLSACLDGGHKQKNPHSGMITI